MRANAIQDDQKRMKEIESILRQIPPENRANIEFLFRLLSHLTLEESSNKMSASNIIMLFSPNLLWDKQTKQTITIENVYRTLLDKFSSEPLEDLVGEEIEIVRLSKPRAQHRSTTELGRPKVHSSASVEELLRGKRLETSRQIHQKIKSCGSGNITGEKINPSPMPRLRRLSVLDTALIKDETRNPIPDKTETSNPKRFVKGKESVEGAFGQTSTKKYIDTTKTIETNILDQRKTKPTIPQTKIKGTNSKTSSRDNLSRIPRRENTLDPIISTATERLSAVDTEAEKKQKQTAAVVADILNTSRMSSIVQPCSAQREGRPGMPNNNINITETDETVGTHEQQPEKTETENNVS